MRAKYYACTSLGWYVMRKRNWLLSLRYNHRSKEYRIVLYRDEKKITDPETDGRFKTCNRLTFMTTLRKVQRKQYQFLTNQ